MANHIKNIEASLNNLGDIMMELTIKNSDNGELDRVRSVLAMRMNQYTDIALTDNDVRKIAKSFMDIEVGSSTNLVMICSKEKCLYKNRCALYGSDKSPIGRECLHENKILTVAMDKYLSSLNIDLDNYPEMVMVNQLVEYELLEYRCNSILSADHVNMKMESIIGVDERGNVVTKEEVSHAIQIKMLVYKNKIQLLQELTATRKEKWKKTAALKEAKDGPSQLISSMKNKMKELRSKQAIDIVEMNESMNALSDIDLSLDDMESFDE